MPIVSEKYKFNGLNVNYGNYQLWMSPIQINYTQEIAPRRPKFRHTSIQLEEKNRGKRVEMEEDKNDEFASGGVTADLKTQAMTMIRL